MLRSISVLKSVSACEGLDLLRDVVFAKPAHFAHVLHNLQILTFEKKKKKKRKKNN